MQKKQTKIGIIGGTGFYEFFKKNTDKLKKLVSPIIVSASAKKSCDCKEKSERALMG